MIPYLIGTLFKAFIKLAPLIAFGVAAYFLFIKFPFLFLKKGLQEQKDQFKDGEKKSFETQKYSKPEKHEQPKSHKKTDRELFGYKENEVIDPKELKKRYLELIKKNHPDKVDSMSEDFKKLAEKNTKEINEAYKRLIHPR
jgi:uncharacterized short protein YbdD (DUF466 family)